MLGREEEAHRAVHRPLAGPSAAAGPVGGSTPATLAPRRRPSLMVARRALAPAHRINRGVGGLVTFAQATREGGAHRSVDRATHRLTLPRS